MYAAYGVSWNDSKGTRIKRGVASAILAVIACTVLAPSGARALQNMVSVIVRALPGAGSGPERAVRTSGGVVERRIGIINGFVARVPANSLAGLQGAPGVLSVTPNMAVRPMSLIDGYDASTDTSSIYDTTSMTGAQAYWRAGYTGKGIGIALIDTGVAPVGPLSAPGAVINGADLSFESQASNLRYLDTYGHGTHMAGIIAGKDPTATPGAYAGDPDHFLGMAPDAHIVSVKVGDSHGFTDVSQMLAAIDWVVQHRNDNGMNIRVLNLSFGTDSGQSYLVDPLAYAAEVAWRAGIVVVAASGNAGWSKWGTMSDPAYDPNILAVGATDPMGTLSLTDDTVPSFSSSGNYKRYPDIVAPGKSVASLRDPNSYIDQTFPGGRVNSTLFRGSGTSQATAVVSGAAALVLQQRPSATPDQVKALLDVTATPLAVGKTSQGNGELNLTKTLTASTPNTKSLNPVYSTGTGSVELARGSVHLTQNGVTLQGETDIFGAPLITGTWAALSLAGNSWSGGVWNGNSWSGNSWSGNSWSGNSWSGNSWSGNSWSGNSWSSVLWSGNSWSGNSWSGNSWSGNSWSSTDWSGNSWSGNSWSDAAWS